MDIGLIDDLDVSDCLGDNINLLFYKVYLLDSYDKKLTIEC